MIHVEFWKIGVRHLKSPVMGSFVHINAHEGPSNLISHQQGNISYSYGMLKGKK
jgi:hypothetical protein